jgi:hypothetical protein
MTKPRRRIDRAPLVAERVRCLGNQGFAFVPNRFLLDGFFAALEPDPLRLYVLLVLAGDRKGMSFYHYDTLCSLLRMPRERYVRARDALIDDDLIAFDGACFQVLELPSRPPSASEPLRTREQFELKDPATVRCLIEQSLHDAGQPQHRYGVGKPVDCGDDDPDQE